MGNRTTVSYDGVRAIEKHVETHRQRASCRDEMTGDDGMIGESRRWWPWLWPSSGRAQGREVERRNGWSSRVGGRGEERRDGRQAGQSSYPALPRLSRARVLASSLFGTIFVLIDLRHMRHRLIFDRHTSPSNQILTHLLALAITQLRYRTSLSAIIAHLLPGSYAQS